MNYKKIKTAVIGCGMISDIYLKNLKEKFSVIDLDSCADIVEKKAREKSEKYGIKMRSVEQIISDEEIKLIINLTYPSSHYEITKAALLNGKNVYSEKCMAVTASEAEELYSLAKNRNLRLSVAPDTFLGGSWQTARKIVDAGLIGTPVAFNAVLIRGYHLVKNDADDLKRKFSVMYPGGGIPYDMGAYFIYNLINLFGPIRRVLGNSFTRNPIRPYLNPNHSLFNENFKVKTPNTMAVTLEFDKGVIGNLLITSDPNNFGDRIYLKTRGDDKNIMPFTHPYLEDSRGLGAAELAWSMLKNRPQRISPDMGLHVMKVLAAAEKCGETGICEILNDNFSRPAPLPSLYYCGECDEKLLCD